MTLLRNVSDIEDVASLHPSVSKTEVISVGNSNNKVGDALKRCVLPFQAKCVSGFRQTDAGQPHPAGHSGSCSELTSAPSSPFSILSLPLQLFSFQSFSVFCLHKI